MFFFAFTRLSDAIPSIELKFQRAACVLDMSLRQIFALPVDSMADRGAGLGLIKPAILAQGRV
jgi:hypothetical protein